MKKKVSVDIQVLNRYSSYSFDELVKLLEDELKVLESDQRPAARFEIKSYRYDYDPTEYYALFLTFDRLETDEEEKLREDSMATYANQRAETDRAEYERLRKQFEGK